MLTCYKHSGKHPWKQNSKDQNENKKNRMPDYTLTLGFGPRPPEGQTSPLDTLRTENWKNWDTLRYDCLCTWQGADYTRSPNAIPCRNEGSADIHRSYSLIVCTIIAQSETRHFASWLSQRLVDFRSFWTRLGPLRGAAVTSWRILTLERPMSHLSLQMLWCIWRFLEQSCMLQPLHFSGLMF